MNILTDPWNVVFFVGFLAYLRIRGVYAHRTKSEEKTHRQIDGLEKTLLIAVISSSLLLPILYLFTPLLNFADYDLPAVVRWLGAAIMLAALWLFWRSHADLGQNWSVSLEIRKGHQLVRHGVYRLIRHPMYAAIWLWSIAQALLLANWLAGWSAVVPFAAMYFLRTPREERMLCEYLGQDYRDYMRQTGRLFPRLRRTDAGAIEPRSR
jgi:protein-S-isoprenylcysteine O-methyltransferase Ste14